MMIGHRNQIKVKYTSIYTFIGERAVSTQFWMVAKYQNLRNGTYVEFLSKALQWENR